MMNKLRLALAIALMGPGLANADGWEIESNADETVTASSDEAGNMFGVKCENATTICMWAVKPLNGCGQAGEFTTTLITDGYPTPVKAQCLPAEGEDEAFVVFSDFEQISNVVASSKTVAFSAQDRFATGPIAVAGAAGALQKMAKRFAKK